MSRFAIIAAAAAFLISSGDAMARKASHVSTPQCPSISILPDAERLAVMDGSNVDFAAEIRKPLLECKVSGSTAKSSLSFWVKGAVSPNGSVAERSVPYFVAVISNGQVIDKKVFSLKLPFKTEDRKVLVKEQVARIDIPVASGKTAEDYSVTIGFQLTPEQAAYNRTAGK